MLLHVSVCDRHQGARTSAYVKLHLLKMFGKNTSLWTCSGVAAYYVKSAKRAFVTLARPKYELPDTHRPKHVGAFWYKF
jgi:hypothetical protein